MKQLNDKSVAALKPTGEQYDVYCSLLSNFGVRVSQKGTKSFFYVTRSRRRVNLGRYPAVSPQEARRAAQALSLGNHVETTSETLLEAYNAFLSSHVSPSYSPRAAAEASRLFHKHLSRLHTVPVRDITPRMFTAITDSLATTPSEANHLFAIMRTFFSWAAQREYVDASPLAHLSKPYRERARERVLSDDELRILWKHTASAASSFQIIIWLLVFTAQRKGEIASLKWGQVTDDALHFPKTKNGKAHSIPKTDVLTELFQDMHRGKPDEYVFPHRSGQGHYDTWSQPMASLLRKTQLEHFTLHDLRRTAATGMAKLGVQPHIIERILNHSTPVSAIAAVYNRHHYDDEMRRALTTWQNHILNIVS